MNALKLSRNNCVVLDRLRRTVSCRLQLTHSRTSEKKSQTPTMLLFARQKGRNEHSTAISLSSMMNTYGFVRKMSGQRPALLLNMNTETMSQDERSQVV